MSWAVIMLVLVPETRTGKFHIVDSTYPTVYLEVLEPQNQTIDRSDIKKYIYVGRGIWG